MRWPLAAVLALLLQTTSVPASLPPAYPRIDTSEQQKPERSPCCFVNSGFRGVCEVTPGQGETCESILRYLNNPRAVGKTYCTDTNIRGGWKQASCRKAAVATDSAERVQKKASQVLVGLKTGQDVRIRTQIDWRHIVDASGFNGVRASVGVVLPLNR
jgi:hypothetical protein